MEITAPSLQQAPLVIMACTCVRHYTEIYLQGLEVRLEVWEFNFGACKAVLSRENVVMACRTWSKPSQSIYRTCFYVPELYHLTGGNELTHVYSQGQQ